MVGAGFVTDVSLSATINTRVAERADHAVPPFFFFYFVYFHYLSTRSTTNYACRRLIAVAPDETPFNGSPITYNPQITIQLRTVIVREH